MNRWAHWLSMLSMAHHLFTGLTQVIPIGPPYLPASFVIIYGWLGSRFWLIWPGLYLVTGIFAGIGVRWPGAMRVGFTLCAAIHLIWGAVSLYGWALGSGGTLQGTSTYWLLSAVFVVIAIYVSAGVRSDIRDERTVQLAEKLGVPADPGEVDE